MKILRMLSVFAVLTLALAKSNAQNVNISLSAPNAGIIKVGQSLFLEAQVGNTSSSATVAAYKLRPLFSFPDNVEVLASGHQLPTGWVVLSNDGQNIRIGNGAATIPPNTARTFYIAIRGKSLSATSNSGAVLSFANGVAPGNTPGSATNNNSTSDDNATAGIQTVACDEAAITAPVVTATADCEKFVLTSNATGVTVWSTGATTPSITVTAAGSYFINAIVGCPGRAKSNTIVIGTNPIKTWYQDSDNDLFGGIKVLKQATKPLGYVAAGGDCNDMDNTVYPGAPELADGKDNNCDGIVDNGLACRNVYYQDADNDNFGISTVIKIACVKPTGYVSAAGDCNDKDNTVYPGAPELNDGKDNDCDGMVDEGLACATQYFKDGDNDGFGLSSSVKIACVKPTGYAAASGDCNDKNATVYPGAPELADGLDNDCDGQIDEGIACTQRPWYRDADNDGFGSAIDIRVACQAPLGYISASGDCNDKDATVYPGAPELADSKDNDCDGQVDEGVCTKTTWYLDSDGDGFGSNVSILVACLQPARYIATSGDCNDRDATVYPGAPELADGKDNDCDGIVDDVTGTNCRAAWYADADGDGFGSNTVIRYACVQPVGFIAASGDCNDRDNAIYPGAPELNDGKDNDCNGIKDDNCTTLAVLTTNGKVKNPERFQPTNKSAATPSPLRAQAVTDDLQVSVYPNPANTEFMVSLDAFVPNQKIQITFLQVDGKVQKTQTLTPNVKGQQLRYSVSSLPAGVYKVNVTQGSKQQSKSVVVAH